ncbi:lysozyme [Novosphingobium guangzhouense]|uniref:Lysozyme n=1 Tax=Novosphingobium guangzhouense TaxID=1850347 RepID=A0A2K2G0W2_9SPHN|nr:lysozyme [Novosphingobium guangzhouense]PNU04618.1 muraminidase [Novosphingobium guangzhouense]
MKLSKTGLDLIKHFEGLRLNTYRCQAGVLTIGYGHTGSDVKSGMKITEAQADAYLVADVAKFERAVADMVKVPLTQSQFDALVSFTFNLGAGKVKSSTLIRKVNAGDFAEAAAEFAKWRLAGGKVSNGLVTRRAAEAKLFQTK